MLIRAFGTDVTNTPPAKGTPQSKSTPDSTQKWMNRTFADTTRIDSPALNETNTPTTGRHAVPSLRRSILTRTAHLPSRHASSHSDMDDHRLPMALPSTADPIKRSQRRAQGGAKTAEFDDWYTREFKAEIEEIVVAVQPASPAPAPKRAAVTPALARWIRGANPSPVPMELHNVANRSHRSSSISSGLGAEEETGAAAVAPSPIKMDSSISDLSSVMLDHSIDEEERALLDASCDSLRALYANTAPSPALGQQQRWNDVPTMLIHTRPRLSSQRLGIAPDVVAKERYSELCAIFGGQAARPLPVDARTGKALQCIVRVDELFGPGGRIAPGDSLCQCTISIPSYIPAETRSRGPSGAIVQLPFTIYELCITATPMRSCREKRDRAAAAAGAAAGSSSSSSSDGSDGSSSSSSSSSSPDSSSPDSSEGVLRWSVFRRYSDFERLATRLQKGGARSTIGASFVVDEVPPKTWWSRCPTDAPFLRARQAALQQWLRLVLGLPALLHPGEVGVELPRELLDFVQCPHEAIDAWIA